MTDKQALRRKLRSLRAQVPPDYRRDAALAAAGFAPRLPEWHRAQRVACYLATPEEFDCLALIEAAWLDGKQTYLPAMGTGTLLYFRRYGAGDALVKARFGIQQPGTTADAVATGALDIMFLPLVGWSRTGARLGMGAGYYDRALAAARPAALVGLGYDCQECEDLPQDAWDVPLDYIMTESRLLACPDDDVNAAAT